jgi:hypothetical protein
MDVNSQLHIPADLLLEKKPPVYTEYQAIWGPEPIWKEKSFVLPETYHSSSVGQLVAHSQHLLQYTTISLSIGILGH